MSIMCTTVIKEQKTKKKPITSFELGQAFTHIHMFSCWMKVKTFSSRLSLGFLPLALRRKNARLFTKKTENS